MTRADFDAVRPEFLAAHKALVAGLSGALESALGVSRFMEMWEPASA